MVEATAAIVLTAAEKLIDSEIRAGLGNEQERITDDMWVLDYFHLRGGNHVPFRRNEGLTQWNARPHQTHPLTRRVVKILCSRLYSPGPAREIKDDPEANETLQAIYRDNMIDQIMGAADEMATLLGVAAIQAAFLGDESLKPVKLYLWDRSQLVLYSAADDPTKLEHVVTIDRFDNQGRYTWWSDRFYRTYVTDKLTAGQTAGGRAAKFDPARSGPNPYGRLPFGLVYHELPTTNLVPPGIGMFVAERNAAIDVKIDKMDAAVNAYHSPQGYLHNARADWNPNDRDNRAGDLIRVPPVVGETPREVRIEYPQANLDIESGHLDIEKTIDTVMEGLGVPQTLYRMDQSSLPSGESQKAEQQPLIDYTEKRRKLFEPYETDLAEAILAVAGIVYQSPAATEAGTRGLNLSLRWPPEEPSLEDMQVDQMAIADESKSLLMVIQERFRLSSRKEALEHAKQVGIDNKELQEAAGLGPLAALQRQVDQQKQMMAAQAAADGQNQQQPPPPDTQGTTDA